ncbi:hypothetical protein LTR86_002819 [Recurvomyces mirabilis]|nr:hypothetical protein LTR86_002819 [Recurvomyces mirabilis]
MALPHRVASSAMQNRIQELLAKHQPIFTLERAEASPYPTASLLGLPGELRHHIYKYALWHQQSDGLICPAPDLRLNRNYVLATVPNSLWRYSENERVSDGSRLGAVYRFNMRGNDILPVNLLHPAPLNQPQGQHQAQAVLAHSLAKQHADAHNAVEIQRQAYNKSLTALERYKHVCTLKCLRQPALTFVSRRVREDSLPVFYAVNTIHFEMANFSVPRILNGRCRQGECSPVDWWRGIEDTNLRAIDNFVLVLDGASLAWGPVAVVYKKRKNSHKVTVVELAGRPVHPQASVEAKLGVSSLFTSSVAAIEEGGLHVRGLERLLASFGEGTTSYLFDRLSLD